MSIYMNIYIYLAAGPVSGTVGSFSPCTRQCRSIHQSKADT